ncbi:MAG TPA: DUF6188 family protein [Mycobacterium sp.]|jgi:hypothetical protein|nr:DUF6188 family protein [Mycobacterium sp.]
MDLGLRGKKVVSQQIEYTVAMYLSDGYLIRFDGPFALLVDNQRVSIAPDVDPPEHFDPVRQLVGDTIRESLVDDSGALSISFDTGARIECVPDEQFESWTLAGPRGFKVVSMPGGDLAVWDEADPDELRE